MQLVVRIDRCAHELDRCTEPPPRHGDGGQGQDQKRQRRERSYWLAMHHRGHFLTRRDPAGASRRLDHVCDAAVWLIGTGEENQEIEIAIGSFGADCNSPQSPAGPLNPVILLARACGLFGKQKQIQIPNMPLSARITSHDRCQETCPHQLDKLIDPSCNFAFRVIPIEPE